jgi:signal transduction histidine kinase
MMSPPDHRPPDHTAPEAPDAPDHAPPRPAPDAPESGPQLAHELANLLDGSLRNVGLVLGTLRDSARAGQPVVPIDDDLIQRLETVSTGLRQMADLIHRWMGWQHEAAWQHHDTRTLRQIIDHATRLLQPAAMSRRINIAVSISDDAANLPAASVYPILANSLRNGIEAIAGDPNRPEAPGTIQVGAAIVQGALELTIADNGPGICPTLLDESGQFRFGMTSKPNGHGLGLSLCRDIAARLGGALLISNRSPRGTELRLRMPLPSAARGQKGRKTRSAHSATGNGGWTQ